MRFNQMAKQAEKFTVDNSPAILTAVGVSGVIATSVLTGKASIKAADILRDEQSRRNLEEGGAFKATPIDKKEAVNLVWKEFIPPVAMGTVTVGAIICANQIGNRRTAAVAAAYAVSEKAFGDYKEKVIEKLGESKHQTVVDDIAADRVRNNPVSKTEVIVAGSGDVLCYEAFTGRYFKSSMEEIKKAQNDLNYRVINDNYASLSDFYDLLGLEHTSMSDDVGWNLGHQLEIDFSTTMSDDGRPCISIDFRVEPIRGFFRIH